MNRLLKDIRKMTDSDIRLGIEGEKIKIARYNGINKEAAQRALKNLTKFEQVADERKIKHE